jgi:hypothetical protein
MCAVMRQREGRPGLHERMCANEAMRGIVPVQVRGCCSRNTHLSSPEVLVGLRCFDKKLDAE